MAKKRPVRRVTTQIAGRHKRAPGRRRKRASVPKVRVRMYRQGLGDCFLITFDVGGSEKHMLIDCGTLGATTTGVKLAKVVEDIKTTTKKHLHLLIATHEHWDHVAAFDHLQAEFKAKKGDVAYKAYVPAGPPPVPKD